MRFSNRASCERPRGAGKRRLIALVISALACLVVAAPVSAHKISKKELQAAFLPFADCPLTSGELCVLANTTSGEFVIGSKTVPIGKPILLQGGLAELSLHALFANQPLIAPASGEALARVPQEVPGGLAGVAGLGGEVTATAELAGPPSSVIVNAGAGATGTGIAVALPLKVKLSNEELGEDCYIGSDAEPIVLHLTDGKTEPPAGTEPISGSHSTPEYPAPSLERIASMKLVDNTFAVPGASGCGNETDSSLIDEALDLDVGLPSAAGKNTAIMSGSVSLAASATVAEYLPKAKKHKK